MTPFKALALSLLAASALAGCGGGSSASGPAQSATVRMVDGAMVAPDLSTLDPLLASVIAQDMALSKANALAGAEIGASPERMSALFSGSTVASFGAPGFHRTQIVHYGADGRFQLWSQGLEKLSAGEWRIGPDRRGETEICFRSAREGGGLGAPDCETGPAVAGIVREIAAGDVFGLAGGAAPFALEDKPEYQPLAELLARTGGAAPQIRWSRESAAR